MFFFLLLFLILTLIGNISLKLGLRVTDNLGEDFRDHWYTVPKFVLDHHPVNDVEVSENKVDGHNPLPVKEVVQDKICYSYLHQRPMLQNVLLHPRVEVSIPHLDLFVDV